MANNRTRSVLLLGLAIRNKWLLNKGKLRILDGLAQVLYVQEDG